MSGVLDIPVKMKMLKKFKDTVGGITFVASDTKRLVKSASDGDIKSYCRALQQYKFKFSRDYSIVLLIISPIVVIAGALYKYIKEHGESSFDEFHEKIYDLEYDVLHENQSNFRKLCDCIGEGDGTNIAKILREKLPSYRKMLQLLSGNKYGHTKDVFMDRVERISSWRISNKKYMNNKLVPFVRDTLGSEFSSKIKHGLNAVNPDPSDPDVKLNRGDLHVEVLPDTRRLPEETKKHIEHISESLKRKKGLLLEHKKSDGTPCKNTYDELKTLLEGDGEGAEDVSYLLDGDYCEWKDRLTRRHYSRISDSAYENYALMNLAHSLRLAKAEHYDASDPKNNELMVGSPQIDEANLETIEDDDEHKEKINERLDKIIVEDEDILRSAQRHFDELGLANKKFGFLNAGDPYDPNGFLPNNGSALEEYLSMNTTLCRDLSHKKFRREGNTAPDAFYTERDKAFPPVVGFPVRDPETGRYYYDNEGAWDRLTGAGRSFYHERGLMSKNVYLTRDLGDLSKRYDAEDNTSPWNNPKQRCDDFDVDRTSGLGSKPFCILSIAGLEDRSKQLLIQGGDGHTAEEYQTKWREITMKQCEFVLKAFIKEGVQVLFLCAFGAGCFGGLASIVASCFRELLIRRGYINYFDKVVFPIGRGARNFRDFQSAFRKRL